MYRRAKKKGGDRKRGYAYSGIESYAFIDAQKVYISQIIFFSIKVLTRLFN